MNTAIRPEDMERYLREMRAFAKRAGYTISPPSPPAPPAVEEPPLRRPPKKNPRRSRTRRPDIRRPLWSRSGSWTRAAGKSRPAPEEEETPCVPCEAAAEDDGL